MLCSSAGVLDPEELSIINKGIISKAERPLLPGIQEDVRRCTESNSTFDSDSLTLESIQIDLFEDVRASIQKSSKSSNVASSRNNTGQVERGTQCLRYLKALAKSSNGDIRGCGEIIAGKKLWSDASWITQLISPWPPPEIVKQQRRAEAA